MCKGLSERGSNVRKWENNHFKIKIIFHSTINYPGQKAHSKGRSKTCTSCIVPIARVGPNLPNSVNHFIYEYLFLHANCTYLLHPAPSLFHTTPRPTAPFRLQKHQQHQYQRHRYSPATVSASPIATATPTGISDSNSNSNQRQRQQPATATTQYYSLPWTWNPHPSVDWQHSCWNLIPTSPATDSHGRQH